MGLGRHPLDGLARQLDGGLEPPRAQQRPLDRLELGGGLGVLLVVAAPHILDL